MADNPFQAPQATSELPVDMKQRPIGVTLLAIFQALSCLTILLAMLYLWRNIAEYGPQMAPIVSREHLLLATWGWMAMLHLASCIGLWKGSRWGWWLACIAMVYSILLYGYSLIGYLWLSDVLPAEFSGGTTKLIRSSVRVVVYAALTAYLLKLNVRRYFGLVSLPKAKALGGVAALAIVLYAANRAIVYLIA